MTFKDGEVYSGEWKENKELFSDGFIFDAIH